MKFAKVLFGCVCVVWALAYVVNVPSLFAGPLNAYGYGRIFGTVLGFTLASALALKMFTSAGKQAREERRWSRGEQAGDGEAAGILIGLVALLLIGAGGWWIYSKGLLSNRNRPAMSVESAQKEAVRRHPQLGIAGSPLNREFLVRHQRYQREHPELFTDPAWPLRLAEESQQAISSSPGTLISAPAR